MRLGYVSEKCLLEVAKQNLLNSDEIEKLKLCDNCILWKARRVSFGISLHASSKPFEYALLDLYGLAKIMTCREAQMGTKLKCLRTNNDLEFAAEQFNKFCKKLGIQRHKTIVGTPQQNSLVERMNRTILEKRVRCMLIAYRKLFRGEVVTIVVHLIDRCPSCAIKFKTPMEL
ncbi:hypothetical protein CR513_18449, partial [Mucuna pruriens]